MQCEEVQEYLAERLAGSLSDRLSGTVHSYVRTHMLSCQECCEEMEDFEGMQTVLRTIPVEPCDSTAMRARFDLLMGAKEAKIPRTPSISSWLLLFAATAIVAVALLAARQAGLWNSVAKVAPPVPIQTSEPDAAPVRTEAGFVPAVRPAPPEMPLGKATVTGHVTMEDGSEVSDTLSLGEVAMSAAGNPGNNSVTIVNLDSSGRFKQSVSPGDYRFRVALLSQDFVIRSFTAGVTDLLMENLSVSADSSVPVEIRVARRGETAGGRVSGTVLDALTNGASPADRVVLCCFANGPAESISTRVQPDGTFVFSGVPAGHYTAGLRSGNSFEIANPMIDVPAAGTSGLKLLSASQMVAIDVTLRLDTGDRLPYTPDTSIVFIGSRGTVRAAAAVVVGNLFRASVPANESYSVAVSNSAAGYMVQSIVSLGDAKMTDLTHGGRFTVSSSPAPAPRLTVTLAKN